MLDQTQFLQQVQESAALPDAEQAQRLCAHVLHSLSLLLPPDLREQLAQRLPDALAADMRPRGGISGADPDPLVDGQLFIGPLVNDFDTTYGYDQSIGGLDLVSTYADDDAKRQVQAVFQAVQACIDASLARRVEQALPDDLDHWWRSAQAYRRSV